MPPQGKGAAMLIIDRNASPRIAKKARKTRRENRLLRAQLQKQQPELRSPL
jgi:hypothetical protein